jgi:hypothetical protein
MLAPPGVGDRIGRGAGVRVAHRKRRYALRSRQWADGCGWLPQNGTSYSVIPTGRPACVWPVYILAHAIPIKEHTNYILAVYWCNFCRESTLSIYHTYLLSHRPSRPTGRPRVLAGRPVGFTVPIAIRAPNKANLGNNGQPTKGGKVRKHFTL